jgi:UTP--glucose-1-phosphate uridylyltransferase
MEAIYAYTFSGKRYDVGDRFGFLQATIDFALKRDELREDLLNYFAEMADFNCSSKNIKFVKAMG